MSLHTRLFVGNIPLEANDADIRESFSSYGEIKNIELKTKPGTENDEDKKRFAFITLSASNHEIESCIKYYSNADFNGHKLYVTRARESFLERLQRERHQTNRTNEEKNIQIISDKEVLPKANPVITLSAKLNHQKWKIDSFKEKHVGKFRENVKIQKNNINFEVDIQQSNFTKDNNYHKINDKKEKSEKKRLESLKKKRQEFKEKKMIIKTGLVKIDKVPNKKVIFSDNEDNVSDQVNLEKQKNNTESYVNGKRSTLFDDYESDSEVNFEIKTQFEGKKGQKVLDLQSRYKSDKRFTLDERFIDDDQSANENEAKKNDEEIDVGQTNEALKQLNILQDVLGVSIRMKYSDHIQKAKPKLSMLRYDPMHPDHAKFLAPTTILQEAPKKVKKKNTTAILEDPITEEPKVVEKVEVSKEQFYKVSDTLKEAMIQTSSFSLRNLFPREENEDNEKEEQNSAYVPLPKDKKKKCKNPLDIGERNPFIYDSSDSECEDNKEEIPIPKEITENKAVWRENLFFSKDDHRLKEGLLFFVKNNNEVERQKERRGLKSVMKKRIYNKNRKSQMFQKKIGGRKKSMKKSIKGKR